MIVAHLIGGNEVKGIQDGVVEINGTQLATSYKELAAVCGNISLGALDTSRDSADIQKDYIEMVKEFDEDLGSDFVIENHLTKEICYSTYEIDFEKRTLKLIISTYE